MLISKVTGSFKCNFDDFTMYQIEHVDKLSMLSMGAVKVILAGGPGSWCLGVN